MKACPLCGNIVNDADDGICWHCQVCKVKPRFVGNTSTNIGIPEKRGGWMFVDIQYHGSCFYNGEW